MEPILSRNVPISRGPRPVSFLFGRIANCLGGFISTRRLLGRFADVVDCGQSGVTIITFRPFLRKASPKDASLRLGRRNAG